ncbi:MAG: patatin-like phospholipase family protein [Lachnospiraceae bacterium]|nr:patatin-like phospholipase family protein [Lachnospiraceae bacterium]
MEPVIDLTKEYGIVLEGGGAKGAYQVGAWRALREAGIKICAVAGTSVGALNGALMCMDDYEGAKEIWENISYSQIMDVDDEKMRQMLEGKMDFNEAVKTSMAYLTAGGVDITPLKNLINAHIDEDKIRNSPVDFYLLTFNVDQMKEMDLDTAEIEPGLIKDFLLASAYIFPLFKNEKLHGKTYIDGGAINNLPLDSLVKRDYKDIIMIRIFGIGREKKVKIPEDTNVYSIEPRIQLGNIIDFDPKKSKRNMTVGYYDAMRMIYGLAGNIYYIEENKEECYYLNQLVDLDEAALVFLLEYYHLPDEESLRIKNLLTIILPIIAVELKLGVNWNYRDMYLAVLEATAKLCKVKKYRIYTVEELAELVREKQFVLQEKENIPAFVSIIMNYRNHKAEEVDEIEE